MTYSDVATAQFTPRVIVNNYDYNIGVRTTSNNHVDADSWLTDIPMPIQLARLALTRGELNEQVWKDVATQALTNAGVDLEQWRRDVNDNLNGSALYQWKITLLRKSHKLRGGDTDNIRGGHPVRSSLIDTMLELQQRHLQEKNDFVKSIQQKLERLAKSYENELKNARTPTDQHSDIAALQTINIDLQSQVKTLRSEVETLNKQARTCEALQTTNMDLQSQVQTLRSEMETLNKQARTCAALRTTNTKLQSQVETLRSEVETLNKQARTCEALQTTNIDLQSQVQTLRSEVETLNKQAHTCAALQTTNTTLQSEVETLRSDLELLRTTNTKLQVETLTKQARTCAPTDQHSDIAALRSENEALRGALQTLEQRSTQEREQVRQEREQALTEFNTWYTNVQNNAQSWVSNTERDVNVYLTTLYNGMNEQVKNIERNRELLEERNKVLNDKLLTAEEKIEKLKREFYDNNLYKNLYERVQHSTAEATANQLNAEEKAKATRAEAEEYAATVAHIQDQLREAKTKQDDAEAKVEQIQNELIRCKDAAARELEQYIQFKNLANTRVAEYKAELERGFNNQLNANEYIEDIAQLIHKDHAAEVAALQKQNTELENTLAALTREVAQYREKTVELEGELQTQGVMNQQREGEIRQIIDTHAAEVAALQQQQNAKLQGEFERQRVAAADNHAAEVAALQKELNKLQDELQREFEKSVFAEVKLQAILEDNANQCAAKDMEDKQALQIIAQQMQQITDTHDAKVAALQKQNTELENTLAALTREAVQHREKIVELEGEFERQRVAAADNHAAEVTALQQQNAKLQDEFERQRVAAADKQQSEIRNLEGTLAVLRGQVVWQEQQIETLRQQNDESKEATKLSIREESIQEDRQRTLVDLQKQNTELQVANQQMQEASQRINEDHVVEVAVLKRQIELLQGEFDKQQGEVAAYHVAEVAALQKQRAELQRELAARVQQLEQCTQHNATLTTQLDAVSAIVVTQQEFGQYINENENLKKENENLKKENENLKKENADLKLNIPNPEERTAQVAIERERDTLDKQNNELQSRLDVATSTSNELQRQLDVANTTINMLQKTAADRVIEVEQLATLQSQNKASQNKALTHERDKAIRERNAAVAEANRQRDVAVAEANRQRDAAVEERNEAVAEANRRNAAIQERDVAVAEANRERDEARQEREAAVEEANREREAVAQAIQERDVAREEREKAVEEAKQERDAAIRQLNEAKQELEEAVEQARNEHDNAEVQRREHAEAKQARDKAIREREAAIKQLDEATQEREKEATNEHDNAERKEQNSRGIRAIQTAFAQSKPERESGESTLKRVRTKDSYYLRSQKPIEGGAVVDYALLASRIGNWLMH